MGIYLNSKKPYDNYKEIASSTYYVDKSMMLEELIPLVEPLDGITGQNEKVRSNKYICITRPRRFGKTVMANMIAAYFGKGQDSLEIFRDLKIYSNKHFSAHLNQHDIIFINFHELPRDCRTYRQYIDRIQNRMLQDLRKAYPDAEIDPEGAVWDALNNIYEWKERIRFIFVMDEWDFIFHRKFVTDEDKIAYIDFLSGLLKDQPYVELAYMTGILPIAKYSSGSELNMFCEYTMINEEKFSEFFGFTETEVDKIYEKYLMLYKMPKVTRTGLRQWYDGYETGSGERVYNPRSVILSLSNNHLGSYWTSAGPYDEIFYYIEQNVDSVRDDLAHMVSGIPVPARNCEYAATSMNLTTKDEIFSAMIVYGFLSYSEGFVRIPNRELMGKFDAMIRKEPSLGYVFRLAHVSEEMLRATLEGDTGKMCRILEYAHHTESPLLKYNSEAELTILITLLYLAARDRYFMERESKAGTGYADFLFVPMNPKADALILELKVDDTAEHAVQQIKNRQYALRFMPETGGQLQYTGKILAVGIAYDKKTKKHECKVEVIRGAV